MTALLRFVADGLVTVGFSALGVAVVFGDGAPADRRIALAMAGWAMLMMSLVLRAIVARRSP